MASGTSSFYGLLCFESGYPAGQVPAALPEIHLNLWEQGETVFLDVGLMLDIAYPAETLELFLPWPLQADNLIDLLNRISTPTALPAIFNESWSITRTAQNSGAVVSDPNNNNPHFAIVQAEGALQSRPHGLTGHAVSVHLPTLKSRARSLPTQVHKIYLRFRVRHVPKEFYCVGMSQKDKGLVSSWQTTEIIDFRLNVRRGAPTDLEATVGRFVDFSKVHLFLMRARDHDLVFQDALFKACRSLEDEGFGQTTRETVWARVPARVSITSTT